MIQLPCQHCLNGVFIKERPTAYLTEVWMIAISYRMGAGQRHQETSQNKGDLGLHHHQDQSLYNSVFTLVTNKMQHKRSVAKFAESWYCIDCVWNCVVINFLLCLMANQLTGWYQGSCNNSNKRRKLLRVIVPMSYKMFTKSSIFTLWRVYYDP